VIEIYAITDSPPATPPSAVDLRVVENAGLFAFCGPAQRRDVSEGLLWRHEEIVETLMKTCDLLPVRFGTQVDDEHSVAMVLARQRNELCAALGRVRGAVELSVRVVSVDREAQPAVVFVSGADYLRSKASEAEEQARVASAVHEPLALMARASRKLRQVSGHESLCFAYLVDRGAVASFAARVDGVRLSNPDLHVLCTGPWPPYSFVRE
jgi:Gas vesicle synthesis protein GvpL/GvpF